MWVVAFTVRESEIAGTTVGQVSFQDLRISRKGTRADSFLGTHSRKGVCAFAQRDTGNEVG